MPQFVQVDNYIINMDNVSHLKVIVAGQRVDVFMIGKEEKVVSVEGKRFPGFMRHLEAKVIE